MRKFSLNGGLTLAIKLVKFDNPNQFYELGICTGRNTQAEKLIGVGF